MRKVELAEMSTGEGYPVRLKNRWDAPTTWFAWTVLIAFTALSSYMNGAYAVMTHSRVWFHAGIPAVVLVLGVFLELTFLSSAHRAAKRIVVTGLGASFLVVLIASYLAVLHVTVVWNPHAPAWVNAALAALPDVVMVLAATVVLSLRMKRQAAAAAVKPATESRWRRLADAATNRVEAALAVPETPQVERVVEARGGSTEVSVEPSVKPVDEVVAVSAEPSTKPEPSPVKPEPSPVKPATLPAVEVVDPELEPYMEAAQRMVDEKVVTRKTDVELAEIIAAIERRMSPNAIKTELGYSPSTTAKVSAAWRQWQEEREPALTAVG